MIYLSINYRRIFNIVIMALILTTALMVPKIKPILSQTSLLADSGFDESIDSADLRYDTPDVQDWYESRNDYPTLLFLDESDIGGNTGKKAGFIANTTKNAYLTQEFATPQTDVFFAQWDIYIDSILDIDGSNPDRAGWMLIGDYNPSGTRPGPNSDDTERFVYMAFYKPGGGTEGTMDLVARDRDDPWGTFTTIASGLYLKQWYTIKVAVNVTGGYYDVYVNEEYKATATSRNAKTSVTHISFAQWNDGAGAFYVDNVIATTLPTVPTVSVTPANTTANVGEQFTVNITLDYANRLYGYEIWLSFNNSILKATAIEYMGYLNEPIHIWVQQVNNTAGYVALAVSSQYPATGKTGGSPPPLASINFKCIGDGISPLHLYKTILADDEAKPITHQAVDGQVFGIAVNKPPTIDSYYPVADPVIIEGESQEFNITYSDPDEDPVSVQWYLDGSPTVTTDSYTFVSSYGLAGTYNITVVISDGMEHASHEWTLTVERRVVIEEVTPCDSVGNPKDTFKQGTLAYFKVVISNVGIEPVNVLITVNIYDSLDVTIGVASFQGPIMSGTSVIILGLPIPNTANLGTATVYANAFTNWVHNGGIPYCPEVVAAFNITN